MATKPKGDTAPDTTNPTDPAPTLVITGRRRIKIDSRIIMARPFLQAVAAEAKAESLRCKADKRKCAPSPIVAIRYSVPTFQDVRTYLADRKARDTAKAEGRPLPAWSQDGDTRKAIIRGLWAVEVNPDFRQGTITVIVSDSYTIKCSDELETIFETDETTIQKIRPAPSSVLADVLGVWAQAAADRWHNLRPTLDNGDLSAVLKVAPTDAL